MGFFFKLPRPYDVDSPPARTAESCNWDVLVGDFVSITLCSIGRRYRSLESKYPAPGISFRDR
jgi:hypothetical protein